MAFVRFLFFNLQTHTKNVSVSKSLAIDDDQIMVSARNKLIEWRIKCHLNCML